MKSNNQCLMIETKDHRKFFTYEENLQQLVPFSKAFQAEISLVKIKEPIVIEVLNLEQLAPAICDQSYKLPVVEYEILETKIAKEQRRKKI